MNTVSGRVPSAPGSRASTEPASSLGPPGFDPSRITEMLAAVEGKVLEPFIKKAADEFYCQVMETAEDYFRDNLDWNLRSHLELLQSENQRMRSELYAVDRVLGSFGLTNDARLEALHELDKAKAQLITLRYEIAFRRDRDRSPEGSETRSGSTVGENAGRSEAEVSPK